MISTSGIDKKHCEIINTIRYMASMFGVKGEDRIKAYAEKLKSYNLQDIKKSCVYMTETCDKFPTISELLDQVRVNSQKENKKRDAEYNSFIEKFSREEKRLEEISRQFKKIIGEEKKEEYIKFWFAGVYGKELMKNLDSFGLKLSLFEKSAMFDLADASMNPKRAVEVGLKKLVTLEN